MNTNLLKDLRRMPKRRK